MTTIPPGYRLALVNPEGLLLDQIDLAGYDLTRPVAGQHLADRVASEVELDVRARLAGDRV